MKLRADENQSFEDADEFVDGGVKEYAPISVVLENGAEHVYAILLSPEHKDPVQGDFRTAASIFVRTFAIFMKNAGESDLIDAERLAAVHLHMQKGGAGGRATCVEERRRGALEQERSGRRQELFTVGSTVDSTR